MAKIRFYNSLRFPAVLIVYFMKGLKSANDGIFYTVGRCSRTRGTRVVNAGVTVAELLVKKKEIRDKAIFEL